VVALLIGVLYTLPNFFGEDPPCRSRRQGSVQVDATPQRIEQALAGRHQARAVSCDANSVKVRLDTATPS
jgi:hypothetical protein